MNSMMNRRQALATAAVAVGAASSAVTAAPRRPRRSDEEPFGYCFNTSTVRGQKLAFDEQVELTARAGYDAIEPWIRDIQAFVDKGGVLTRSAAGSRSWGSRSRVRSGLPTGSWMTTRSGPTPLRWHGAT